MERRDFLRGISGATLALPAFGIAKTVAPVFEARTKKDWEEFHYPDKHKPEILKTDEGVATDQVPSMMEVDYSALLEMHLDESVRIEFSKEPWDMAYCAALIRDGDRSHSIDFLIQNYIEPMVVSMADMFNNGGSVAIGKCGPCPPEMFGVYSVVTETGRIPVRCVISYDAIHQGSRVYLDTFVKHSTGISYTREPERYVPYA